MRRRIFSLASLLSLLLFLATAVLWVRSYTYTFLLTVKTARTGTGEEVPVMWENDPPIMSFSIWKVESMPGFLYVDHRIAQAYPPHRLGPNPEDGYGLEVRSAKATPRMFLTPATIKTLIRDDGGSVGVGFGYSTATDRTFPQSAGYDVRRRLMTPFWPLVALFASLPTVNAIGRIRRFLRDRSGACKSCGYSLTGNTSGTCPECGSPIPQASLPA